MKKAKIEKPRFRFKNWLKRNKFVIWSCVMIFFLPILVTLFYMIPCIQKLDIKGDVLQFYAVTLGLLITCVQYRNAKKEQVFLCQQSLKPKISITLNLDNDEINTKLEICNHTDNDYKITYIYHDYYENDKKYNLNSKNNILITIDSWDDVYPKLVELQLEDSDGNSWSVGFEKQENDSNRYYRSYIDVN